MKDLLVLVKELAQMLLKNMQNAILMQNIKIAQIEENASGTNQKFSEV